MLLFLLACTDPAADSPTDKVADTGDTASDTDTDTAEDTADPYEAVYDDVRRALRSALRGNNASGVSIAVWKDGEVIFAEAMGTRSPDTDDIVVPSTLFQIGSDTKKMTAIAALRQVEAGTLSLESTIADIVPELVFARDAGLADTITLHELLSHQTGLFDYTPWVEAPDDADLADRATGRFADNEYAMGPSGLYWNYSNPGFSVAGLLTERAAGRPWADILEDDVFAPLGLTRTFARRAPVEADGDYAIGYGIDLPNGYDTFDPLAGLDYVVGTVPLEDTYDCGFTRPAGLVWSTASDMATFAGFFVDGDPAVLSDALRAEITTPHVPMYPATSADDFGYGYGLMVNSGGWSGYQGYYADVPLWAHGGNTMTMTSAFFVLPEQRVAVAVLSNGYADDFSEAAIVALEGVADLPTPATTAPPFLQPAENPEELAGTWTDPNTLGTLTLTWDGADLLVDAPDLEAAGYTVGATLEPYYKDYYVLRVDETDFDFSMYRGEDGSAYLVNRQFTWTRAPGDVAARPGKPARARTVAAFDAPRTPDLRRSARGITAE